MANNAWIQLWKNSLVQYLFFVFCLLFLINFFFLCLCSFFSFTKKQKTKITQKGAPGEDIAVIMAGYKPQMLKMVQEQNPGLTRRFDPTFAVHFEDFSDGELLEILSLECSRRGVRAPRNVKLYAVRLLSRRRVLANFGNAAAVKTLISNAIERLASRERRQLNQKGRAGKRGQDLRRRSVGGRILMIEDVDPDFAVQGSDPEKALEELRGCETIERELRDLGSIVAIRQHEGRSTEGLVGHYVFTFFFSFLFFFFFDM